MKHVLASRILYPDPFQPSGIEFDLQEEAIVTVTITDATDEIAATPVNQQRYREGTHQVFFTVPIHHAAELFYRIIAEIDGDTVSERKKLK